RPARARRHRTDAGIACMKSLSGRDFARMIERRGWTLRRAAFNSDPRQQAVEEGPAAAFGEARGYFRRRSLAARNPALRVLSSPSLRSCAERAGVRDPSLRCTRY